MAISAAATLAQALTSHPDDLGRALRRYERIHRQRLHSV
jgi:2-polyprenyl-6-methoxyphenol hydroxylase-like FAD-dependent oxidoreductase